MRTFKLPVGRPLPAGRARTTAGPLSAARRSVASLAAVAAVVAASACAASSATTSPAAASRAATGAPTAAAVAPAAAARASAAESGAKAVAPVSAASSSPGSVGTGSASCPTAAWATEVTGDGKVSWKVSLPLASSGVTDGLSPVLSGNYAVFAEGHSLVALRLSDGHQLWRRVFPDAKNSLTGQITFLYGFHSEVIALVGQVSSDTRLVALSLKTGAVSWTLPLGSSAVIGDPVVTIDSVFAFLTPRGRLEAVSLWTGKRLWSRAYGLATGAPALAAYGSRVIAARTPDSGATTVSSVTAFVGQTGKALWTRKGMPQQPTLLGELGGGLLVYDQDQNVYPRPVLFPVTELNPATGKTLFRIPTAGPVSAVWQSAGTIVIVTTGQTPRLYVADPIARRVRWSVRASVDTGTTPLIGAGELMYAQTAANPVTLVARATSSGPVRWSLRVPAAFPRYLVATGTGTTLLSYGQVTVPGKAGALIIGVTGKVVAKISLPAPSQAPPAVTEGNDVVLQLDTLTCSIAASGTAGGITGVGSGVGNTSVGNTSVGTASSAG